LLSSAIKMRWRLFYDGCWASLPHIDNGLACSLEKNRDSFFDHGQLPSVQVRIHWRDANVSLSASAGMGM
jgi:hypothetical protein